MWKSLLACVGSSVMMGAAHAAPSLALCSALQSIESASIVGFGSLPQVSKLNNGFKTQPIVPGATGGSVESAMPRGMMFTIDFPGSMGAMQQAVTTCIPGTRKTYEGSQEANYVTPNKMTINLSIPMSGEKLMIFSTDKPLQTSAAMTIIPVAASEEASPVGIVQNLYNKYYIGKGPAAAMPAKAFDAVITPSFAKLLSHNTSKEGGPIIDGDLLTQMQEFDITSVKTSLVSSSADTAVVSISPVSYGEASTPFTFTLKMVYGAWKIDDIADTRQLYRKAGFHA